jgi:hypothetical protein
MCSVPAARAQEPIAGFVYPINGAVDVDVNQPIRWTAVDGAQAYYLYVGSTPGAKDLLDSGEIHATSISARALPGNKTMFARLHTKHGGVWRSVDARFTVRAVAQVLAPLDGVLDVDARVPIRWSSVEGVEAYYLYVGTAPGLRDLVDSGEQQTTSFGAPYLPGGETVYVRLHTKVDGRWRSVDSRFTVRAVAQFINPLDGATNVDVSLPLRWTAVEGAEAYYLYVGNTPGSKDLFNSGETPVTSIVARALPGGRTMFARLHTKHGGVWRSVDARFTVRAVAQVLAPLDGAVDVDTRLPIRWSAVEGAEAYYLYVGTAPGLKDLVNSGEQQATSFSAPYLPAGKTVYVRLHTKADDEWRFVETRFTVRPVAQLTEIQTGATEVDVGQPLRWTAVEGAQAYYLYIGSAPGLKDLVDSGELQTTSYYAPYLPAGQMVYVRLYTKFAGAWRFVDYSFHVKPVAQLLQPSRGATDVDTRLPIRWTSVSDAEAYYLYIGTEAGKRDLLDTGELTTTSYVARYLPGGAQVFVRLYTKHGGQWRYIDSEFGVRPVAQLVGPADGALNFDLEDGIRWTAVAAAESYRLELGTTAGANDLLDTGPIPDTFTVARRVAGAIGVNARLSTLHGGVWRSVASTFTTSPRPRLISPGNGAHAITSPTLIEWTGVAGATGYRLMIGTEQGGSDVASLQLDQTSYEVSGLPDNQTVFVRVMAEVNGLWRFRDNVMSTAPAPQAAAFIYPSTASMSLDAQFPIEWVATPFAISYRLTIGLAAGRTDILDSGPIKVTRRLAPNMPVGVPLFARLQTNFVDGTWATRDSTFQVSSAAIPPQSRLELALWITQAVRGMSTAGLTPRLHSILADVVAPSGETTALCSDFVVAFRIAAKQVALGLDDRYFETCLNPSNGFDCHVANEVRNPENDQWILLDPTFAMAVRTASGGGFVDGRGISSAMRSNDLAELEFISLDSETEARLRAYYIDYPQLFLNPYAPGSREPIFPIASPLVLFDAVGSSVSNDRGAYSVRCREGESSVELLVDGALRNLECAGEERLSYVFLATDIAQPNAEAAPPDLLRLRRSLF